MNFEFLLLVGIGFFLIVLIRAIFFTKKAYELKVKSILNLQQEVRSLLYERSADFFIVEFGSYFIQYSKLPGTSDVYCMAVSNEFLSKEIHLSDIQYKLMAKNHFILPGEKDEEGNSSQNFFKFYSKNNDESVERLMSELAILIHDVYQYEKDFYSVKVNAK